MATHNTPQPISTTLEQIPVPLPTGRFTLNPVLAPLKKLGQWLIDQLTTAPEITVQQRTDRDGNTWWYVYDPRTGQTRHLSSEAEVLMWVDESFFQHASRSTALWNDCSLYSSRTFR